MNENLEQKENSIKKLLIDLGLSSEDSIQTYYPKVRDRDDVAVLKCSRSNIILLSRTDHVGDIFYNDREEFSNWHSETKGAKIKLGLEDSERRLVQFKPNILNKKWLDVGTGAGGILELLAPFAAEVAAIELEETAQKVLRDLGYEIFPTLTEAKDDHYETVTLFHVLEHLSDPVDSLKLIRQKMQPGGQIIIEVPHALDFLISFLEDESFKAHTFLSEHLILHTRESLTVFLKAAGFSELIIKGFQRFPIANHLYWLTKGKPGGHNIWSHLRTPELEQAYSNLLASINKTDTLIAFAKN